MAPDASAACPTVAGSFESLLETVIPRAFRMAVSLAGNAADAQDLVQEAALHAFRGFGSFAAGTNFKAWFTKILVNCHYGRHRRTCRQPATVDLDDVGEIFLCRRFKEHGLPLDEDPMRRLFSRLTIDEVLAAIDALPEEFRTVTRLHVVDEMGYREIAEILDRPLGTVRSRLHRGRHMLQKMLWHVAEEAGIVNELTGRTAA